MPTATVLAVMGRPSVAGVTNAAVSPAAMK